jgi:hypothetical protein
MCVQSTLGVTVQQPFHLCVLFGSCVGWIWIGGLVSLALGVVEVAIALGAVGHAQMAMYVCLLICGARWILCVLQAHIGVTGRASVIPSMVNFC